MPAPMSATTKRPALPAQRRGSNSLPDLAGPLLAWFGRSRRALPWRTLPRDPYRTWISEVMAQQTRLEVVVPYFERFVLRFPTLLALADAPLDEVLALWSGLGYYARARNLHRAAKAAAGLGGLPSTAAALAELPGFGPYTAAAVASLAFGEDAPLVDGNVARVLARVLRLPGDALAVRKTALDAAGKLLPRGAAGPFNEGLMELGATVCTPRSPRCQACPLAKICASRLSGDPEAWPAPKPRRVRPELHWAALALRHGGSLLLARRGEGELFAGLWELPSAEVAQGAPAADAARLVLERHGLPARCAAELAFVGAVEQTLTHRQVTLRLFSATLRGDRPTATARSTTARSTTASPTAALRWVAPTAAALSSLGISSLAAKALRACGVTPPQRPKRDPPSPL